MSLLSTDIAKVGRISLREIRLPDPGLRVEPIPGENPHTGPEIKPQDIDRPKLIALAQRAIEGEANYTKEEVIERIKETTNVSHQRAEVGFNLMLQAGAIETTQGERYYLPGSTPF